jgi:hypothetical protein
MNHSYRPRKQAHRLHQALLGLALASAMAVATPQAHAEGEGGLDLSQLTPAMLISLCGALSGAGELGAAAGAAGADMATAGAAGALTGILSLLCSDSGIGMQALGGGTLQGGDLLGSLASAAQGAGGQMFQQLIQQAMDKAMGGGGGGGGGGKNGNSGNQFSNFNGLPVIDNNPNKTCPTGTSLATINGQQACVTKTSTASTAGQSTSTGRTRSSLGGSFSWDTGNASTSNARTVTPNMVTRATSSLTYQPDSSRPSGIRMADGSRASEVGMRLGGLSEGIVLADGTVQMSNTPFANSATLGTNGEGTAIEDPFALGYDDGISGREKNPDYLGVKEYEEGYRRGALFANKAPDKIASL